MVDRDPRRERQRPTRRGGVRDRRHGHHPGRDRRRLNEVADVEPTWSELHDASRPAGSSGGRATDEGREWVMYAYDPAERPRVGLRRREWTSVADSEEGVVRGMARCLAELREGRSPR